MGSRYSQLSLTERYQIARWAYLLVRRIGAEGNANIKANGDVGWLTNNVEGFIHGISNFSIWPLVNTPSLSYFCPSVATR